jgi:hypothetical protein
LQTSGKKSTFINWENLTTVAEDMV